MRNPNDRAAFPLTAANLQCSTGEGMTLRDYFAAKAMGALAANENFAKRMSRSTGLAPEVCVAKASFEIADAMLAERVQ